METLTSKRGVLWTAIAYWVLECGYPNDTATILGIGWGLFVKDNEVNLRALVFSL